MSHSLLPLKLSTIDRRFRTLHKFEDLMTGARYRITQMPSRLSEGHFATTKPFLIEERPKNSNVFKNWAWADDLKSAFEALGLNYDQVKQKRLS